MAFLIGWALGWWRTDAGWRVYVAKQQAVAEYAREAERVRQEAAAREIAAEATRRLEQEQAAADDMRRQIDDLKKSEANHAPVKNCPACVVDDDYVKRLRLLDAAGRAAKPARRTGTVR